MLNPIILFVRIRYILLIATIMNVDVIFQNVVMLSVVRCQGIQRNDTQHNDIQHNDTQYKGLICDTQHKGH
jgi:hypothetical protein